MNATPIDLSHPSWRTALATLASYGLVLVAMFVVLFLVPYGLFRAI